MGGGFAGEVPTIELGHGGVEVIEIEDDSCHGAFVGVELDDVETG
ncbi:MAG TPA: hypothetical protein VEH77_03495 [Roseiarcus sp.]|nr:hypothetical protein [Roseiarcus sp.]